MLINVTNTAILGPQAGVDTRGCALSHYIIQLLMNFILMVA